MKSYTDLEQSRILAGILPLESADMHYYYDNDFNELESIPTITEEDDHFVLFPKDVPCWSLAALLDSIPNSIFDNTDEFSQLEFSKRSIAYHDLNDGIKIGSLKDNLIDACYEIILELKEKNLL